MTPECIANRYCFYVVVARHRRRLHFNKMGFIFAPLWLPNFPIQHSEASHRMAVLSLNFLLDSIQGY